MVAALSLFEPGTGPTNACNSFGKNAGVDLKEKETATDGVAVSFSASPLWEVMFFQTCGGGKVGTI